MTYHLGNTETMAEVVEWIGFVIMLNAGLKKNKIKKWSKTREKNMSLCLLQILLSR